MDNNLWKNNINSTNRSIPDKFLMSALWKMNEKQTKDYESFDETQGKVRLSYIRFLENWNLALGDSSMKSSTTSSLYEPGSTVHVQNSKSHDSVNQTQSKEITIEELHKQQLELIKMQEMIQKQMSSINQAIQLQEKAHNISRHMHKNSVNISTSDYSNMDKNGNSSQFLCTKKSKDTEKVLPNSSFVSVNDYNTNYISNPMNLSSKHNKTQEKSVPLFKSATKCRSIEKKRRSRGEREREISADRFAASSYQRRKSQLAHKRNDYANNVYMNNTANTTISGTLMNTFKPRSTFCSKDRSTNNANSNASANHKLHLLEKSVSMINKRVFDNIKRIRPTQTTMRTLKMFFKVLKYFSKHYRQYNENDAWSKHTNTLVSNSNLIIYELKAIWKRVQYIENVPNFLNEMNALLFAKKPVKGVPSCSTAFQKEIKPIVNFCLNLINYFDTVDKSPEHNLFSSYQKSVGRSNLSNSKPRCLAAVRPTSKIKHNTSNASSKSNLLK